MKYHVFIEHFVQSEMCDRVTKEKYPDVDEETLLIILDCYEDPDSSKLRDNFITSHNGGHWFYEENTNDGIIKERLIIDVTPRIEK